MSDEETTERDPSPEEEEAIAAMLYLEEDTEKARAYYNEHIYPHVKAAADAARSGGIPLALLFQLGATLPSGAFQGGCVLAVPGAAGQLLHTVAHLIEEPGLALVLSEALAGAAARHMVIVAQPRPGGGARGSDGKEILN